MKSRKKQLADVVCDYSLTLGPEDTFLIRAEDDFYKPARMLRKAAEARGAKVITELSSIIEHRDLIERNDHAELEKEAQRLCALADEVTSVVRLNATSDPFHLQNTDPNKIGDFQKLVVSPLSDRIVGDGKDHPGKKWLVLGYPCKAHAKLAGMSNKQYTDFVFNACLQDWPELSKEMHEVKNVFDGAKDVHIQVPGLTDLHLSLEGRGAECCDGKMNMPDGEVFYGPVEDSAEGYITFPYTSIRDGNAIDKIKLWYKGGEVYKFESATNQEFLEATLGLDGVKRIGELGIGTNYGIDKYIKNLLFDEKIGGTIHLALGKSYNMPLDLGGGLNKADIHWDLVCDLRSIDGNPGGTLTVDDKLVQENGIWCYK